MSAVRRAIAWPRPPRLARVTLIAVALLFALAGCGKKTPVDARAEVQKLVAEVPDIITDSTRAAAVENAYRQLGDVMLQTIEERRRIATRWNQLYRGYDTPRESLEVLVAATDDASARARAAAIRTREEVRTHTTEKEWKALGATRKRAANLYLIGTP
jgi:hypothetical protein